MDAQDLGSHEWKDRLLLILTSENSKADYQKQIDILKEYTEGLEERKLVVYTIYPDKFKKGLDSKDWTSSGSLNEQYRENNRDFEILLVGLDGGIKIRQDEVMTIEQLFSRIDAMPMRRSEIQRKKNNLR